MEIALRAELDARDARWAANRALLESRLDTLGARLDATDEEQTREALRRLAAEAAQGEREVALLRQGQAALEAAVAALVAAQADGRGGPPPPWSGEPPKVSVVLPTRDRPELLLEAVGSVLSQSLPSWELLVVNDGDRASTSEALRPFLADGRIRLLGSPRPGVGAARNHGLREARGELVAYLDSDNLMLPGFLAGVVKAFDEDPLLETAYGLLVADAPCFGGSRVLFRPFDRAALLETNTIDLNAFVHRRRLFAELGGFDEALTRLVDWDLILRYTVRRPSRALDLLAVYYRTLLPGRITDQADWGSNWFRVKRKWLPRAPEPGPRVLYAVWHYPQVTETYIESEIRALGRLGARIEVWSEAGVAVPHGTDTPVHRGSLAEAIDAFRPDVVHGHWVNTAHAYEPVVAARGLPMTVRTHSFEATPEAIRSMLERPTVRRLYLFPHQAGAAPEADVSAGRVRVVRTPFDTELFHPCSDKDRRLVVRTAAALPAKELGFFLALAREVPTHRFVLVAATCVGMEEYPERLLALAAELGSPAELRLDLPREEAALLVARAGIYLHTALPPSEPGGSPIGMPVSIAEAMATGAHVLVRDLPPLRDQVGPAGVAYRDREDAARLLRATLAWSDADWHAAWRRSVDRAFHLHADETTVAPILADWCQLRAERALAGER